MFSWRINVIFRYLSVAKAWTVNIGFIGNGEVTGQRRPVRVSDPRLQYETSQA